MDSNLTRVSHGECFHTNLPRIQGKPFLWHKSEWLIFLAINFAEEIYVKEQLLIYKLPVQIHTD